MSKLNKYKFKYNMEITIEAGTLKEAKEQVLLLSDEELYKKSELIKFDSVKKID